MPLNESMFKVPPLLLPGGIIVRAAVAKTTTLLSSFLKFATTINTEQKGLGLYINLV